MKKDLWLGLNERTRKALSPRDYKSGSVAQRTAASGVDAAELTTGRGKAELKKVWIPGVEIFSREIHRSRNNVGVVIPPGVAHAIRAEGSEDVIMVYGTSTTFQPDFEGRIASEVEAADLPESWRKFLSS